MKKDKLKLIVIGLIAGFVNGIFGSGGGIVIVVSLVFIIGLEDHKAHATAISIILVFSLISTMIYLIHNSIPLKPSILVAIGGSLGSYIGARFLKKVPSKLLRRLFASVIIYTAIRMILK